MVRTFLGVDKKQNPGFSFLCQTIVTVLFANGKVDAKTVWNSLELLLLFFLIGLFFGLRSGQLDFFWARV